MKIDMSNLDLVTPEFVKNLDQHYLPVWLRDDYLSMRGIAFCGDRKLYDYLERIDNVKEQLRNEGYEFNVDKINPFDAVVKRHNKKQENV